MFKQLLLNLRITKVQQFFIQNMSIGSRNQKQTGLQHLSNPQAYDQVQRRQKQKQLLDLINDKDQTITILHHVNTRLGAQLALLQKKLGIDSDTIIRELQNLQQISVGFHYQIQQLEYLDHLFKAYDQNNLKQKKLIALLYSELQDSEKKSQNLVRDNQFLLNQMQNKCKQILQIYQKGFPEDNLVNTYNKLQRDSEIDLMESMREENQYLTKYSQELEEKFMKVQMELDEAKNSAQKYFQTYKVQAEELKQAFIKVDDLLKVKQVLEKKFDQISQQNIDLESAKEQLETKTGKLDQQIKNTRNQLFSFKKTSRQDVQKIQSELDSMRLQYDNTCKRQKEGFNKLMALERENQTLKDSNRSFKREIEKTKADFENTIRMLEAYQTKILNSKKKMQAMEQFVNENKEQLQDCILQRDKAKLRIEQLDRQNQNLRSKHLEQASHLKTSFQKIINNLNEKIRNLEESKEDLGTELHQRQVTLKNENQKLKRINNELRSENNNLLYSMKSSSGSDIISKIKQLEQKNDNLNRMLNQKDRNHMQQKEHAQETIDNLQQQVRDLSRQLQKERNSCSSNLRQLTQIKSKLSIAINEKECQQNELARLKKLIDNKSHSNQDERDWKVKQLQQQLHESIQKQKSTRQKAIQMLEKYDEAQNQLKVQYENRINELQLHNQKLKRKIKGQK